ncbi:uncharacterized protein [Ptychodera flava]|uniref:uncharacterized protein isoform X2 n=2 Tax=Ptychodera flava TaxID=63121 RepID=UPI00396A3A73
MEVCRETDRQATTEGRDKKMTNRRIVANAFIILSSFSIGYFLANLGVVQKQYTMPTDATIDQKAVNVAELYQRYSNGQTETILPKPGPRKILLDCGANVASTVNLFREAYPDADDYIIHSFEIDADLAPYFAYFRGKGHVLHCPVGVADKDGNMTAYNEGTWFPGKRNHGKDMQWGGGSLFVSNTEGVDKEDGGSRKLSKHDVIPTIDLSQWIQQNINKEDYVIFKLDVEGAEYGILRKMLKDGTMAWIDKFYGEYHPGQPTGETAAEKSRITKEVATQVSNIITWSAETKQFNDFDSVNPPKVPSDTPGAMGSVIKGCLPKADNKRVVSIVIQVGMNAKRARKLITTIEAYHIDVPLTLFVYGDFAEEHPDLVKEWSTKYEIGIRCDGPMSPGHWEIQYSNAIRLSIVSAERRLSDIGLQVRYILPPGVGDKTVIDIITKRQLRLIQPTAEFPPTGSTLLTKDNYHRFRDVEKVPKALQVIHDGLSLAGGILSLDSDFPDNYMISVFLLDYIYETSGFSVVKLTECLSS